MWIVTLALRRPYTFRGDGLAHPGSSPSATPDRYPLKINIPVVTCSGNTVGCRLRSWFDLRWIKRNPLSCYHRTLSSWARWPQVAPVENVRRRSQW